VEPLQGRALLAELRQELGGAYEVWYFNESTRRLEQWLALLVRIVETRPAPQTGALRIRHLR